MVGVGDEPCHDAQDGKRLYLQVRGLGRAVAFVQRHQAVVLLYMNIYQIYIISQRMSYGVNQNQYMMVSTWLVAQSLTNPKETPCCQAQGTPPKCLFPACPLFESTEPLRLHLNPADTQLSNCHIQGIITASAHITLHKAFRTSHAIVYPLHVSGPWNIPAPINKPYCKQAADLVYVQVLDQAVLQELGEAPFAPLHLQSVPQISCYRLSFHICILVLANPHFLQLGINGVTGLKQVKSEPCCK